MPPASWVEPPHGATRDAARSNFRPTPDMGDEQLLGLHLAGCRDSFQVLVERHRGTCIGLAMRILRNPEAAEDEVQNAMLKAHVAAHTFNFQARFSSWLSQIVINECRMRIRAERRRPTEQSDLAILLARCQRRSPEEALAAREVTELVRHEIRRLPTPLRVVLHSVLVEGHSLSECGAQLGLTRAAVKSRLLRAKQEFRLRMHRHHGAMGGLTLLR